MSEDNRGGASLGGDDDGSLREAIVAAVEEDASANAGDAAGASSPPAGQDGRGAGDKAAAAAPGRETPASGERKPPAGEERAAAAPGTPPSEGEGAAQADPRAAPVHWSAEDKATFSALPDRAKAPFMSLYRRMESGFTPKLQRGAALERDYGELDKVFTPEARQLMASKGYQSPVHLINSWAGVENTLLDAQKRDIAIAQIIQAYGANPATIANHLQSFRGAGGDGTPSGNPAPIDPVLAARLERLEGATAAQTAHDHAVRVAQTQVTIDDFANARGADGQLLHPHFATVEPEMTRLVAADRLQGKAGLDLEDLYSRATWGDPNLRSQLIADEKQAHDRQNTADRRAKSEAARRAGSSVSGAPGPGRQGNGVDDNRSLRDTIRANLSGGNTSGGPGRI